MEKTVQKTVQVRPLAEPLFDQLLQLQKEFPGHPPVERWNPEFSGDMDMVIRSDGSWVHEGRVIQRQSLVRLFASILKRENKDYFLVTPVEKWRIHVEDSPFVISQVAKGQDSGQALLLFTTNTGDVIPLDRNHKLTLRPFGDSQQLIPYIEVRNRLLARVSRDVYYQLVDWAQNEVAQCTGGHPEPENQLWLYSGGEKFLLGEY